MKSIGAKGDADVLALLDVLARLRTLQSFPWRCLHSMESRKGLAAVATLIGAGMMGAMMFVRGVSNGALPWLSRGIVAGSEQGSVGEQELTVAGLQNSGNNCFLNAILQALASSQKFMTYLTAYSQDGAVMPLSAALCELLQGKRFIRNLPHLQQGPVSHLLSELAQVGPGHRIISPRHVMRVLAHYAKNFDLAMQQDAAEALSHLATALQQERMEDFEEHKPTLQSLAAACTLSSQCSAITSQEDLKRKIILECWRQQLRWPMEGTFGSLLICSQCGFQASMQFQFFRDVPLSPPQVADGFIINGCTIEDCLDQFTMLERVSNVRCNRCAHLAAVRYLSLRSETNKDVLNIIQSCNYDDNCSCESLIIQRGGIWINVQGDAYKCLRIGRSPEVLCLHIQRATLNNAGEFQKLTGHVSFSMELDLYPFTIAAHQATRKKPTRHAGLSRFAILDSRGMKLSTGAALQALDPKSMMSIYALDYRRAKCVGGDATNADCDGDTIEQSQSEDNTMDCEVSRGEEDHRIEQFVEDHTMGQAEEDYAVNFEVHHTIDSELHQLDKDHSMDFEVHQAEEEDYTMDSEVHQAEDQVGELHAQDGVVQPAGDLEERNTAAIEFEEMKSAVEPIPQEEHAAPSSVEEPENHSVASICQKPVTGTPRAKSKSGKRQLYDLFSVVVHHGGPFSGHYTVYRKVKVPRHESGITCENRSTSPMDFAAAQDDEASQALMREEDSRCKDGGDSTDVEVAAELNGETAWFQISDADVVRVSEKEVLAARAALLFYERHSTD